MKNITSPTNFGLLWLIFLTTTFWACESENVEEKFFSKAPGQEHYNLTIAPLLDTKCFSCHTYHNTLTTRYDSYLKAAGAIDQIIARVTSTNSAAVMPPIGGGMPLTQKEVDDLLEFQRLLADAPNEEKELKIDLTWTAYKYPNFEERSAVSGTFNDISYTYKNQNASDIYEYLAGATVAIETSSVNLGNNDPLKSGNLKNNFFSAFSPKIECHLLSIDKSTKTAMVEISMNHRTDTISFSIEDDGTQMTFKGKLEDMIGDWGAADAFALLDEACGDFHGNKVWPDIEVELKISNYPMLLE